MTVCSCGAKIADPGGRIAAAFRVIACAVAEAKSASRQDYALCAPDSPAGRLSGPSEAPAVHGGAREAQEG